MPRTIFTTEQDSKIAEEWQNGLTTFGSPEQKERLKRLYDILIANTNSGDSEITMAQLKSKIQTLNRKELERKKRAASANLPESEEVPLKGTTARAQFLGEQLKGTAYTDARETLKAAHVAWKAIKGTDNMKVYQDRANEAKEMKKREEMTDEGKKKKMKKLCSNQANGVEELEDLGVHSVNVMVLPNGNFYNASSTRGDVYVQSTTPTIGYDLTSFVHGSSVIPVQKNLVTETKHLQSKVRDLINEKYSNALKVVDPSSSRRCFPYLAYKTTNKNRDGQLITITGMPDGERLHELGRYGVAGLKEILLRRDTINISVGLPQPQAMQEGSETRQDLPQPHAATVTVPEQNGMEAAEGGDLPPDLRQLQHEVRNNAGEDEEYVPEAILGERRKKPGPGKEYLVKWAGCDDDGDNTWEPEESLKHLDIFKEYKKQKSRKIRNQENKQRKSGVRKENQK